MERTEQNGATSGESGAASARGDVGGSGAAEFGGGSSAEFGGGSERSYGSGGSAGSFGSGGSGRGVGSQVRNVFGQMKDRAEDGWGWARKNPWPVVGAAIGLGLLLAWRRRGSADHQLSHMNSDRSVGHSRRFGYGTDEVAEGMSRGSE